MEPIIEFHSSQENVMPMYVCGNCRMLGSIIDRNNDEEAARKCCLCKRCGKNAKVGYYTQCDECKKLTDAERFAEEKAKKEALPKVEYNGGPVFWEQGEKYFTDFQACLDELYDEDIEEGAIVHPCRAEQLVVPCLSEIIEEHWYDELEDARLSEEDRRALAAVEKQIKPPAVWYAITSERLDVPVGSPDEVAS